MDEHKKCEQCGEPVVRKYSGRPSRFCSRACYNANGRPRRKAETAGQRMRRVPGHPLAPTSGTVAECRLVLFDKIGPGAHPCHWCKETVRWLPGAGNSAGALLADHLDWDQQNNTAANLVPSCHICNSHRTSNGGRSPIRPDELFIMQPGGTRTRAVERFCVMCGTAFVAAVSQVKVGRGLYCSPSCARKQLRSPSAPSS